MAFPGGGGVVVEWSVLYCEVEDWKVCRAVDRNCFGFRLSVHHCFYLFVFILQTKHQNS